MKLPDICPCGSGSGFAQCCGPILSGQHPAPTAEALMRSRYTAFALRDTTYLLASWHASTRPATLLLDDTPAQKWIGLQIRSHQVLDADHATVEFLARYRIGGRAQRLHETSRFVREGEYWFYVDGDIHD
ncbi:MAG TPA: YchJ family metal-binding protein [Thauera sp.]|nr:YchJ family metal-binding protein [Thauera sp.]HRA80999.1 YchJ family metal-binding protein [Thauera sp.]